MQLASQSIENLTLQVRLKVAARRLKSSLPVNFFSNFFFTGRSRLSRDVILPIFGQNRMDSFRETYKKLSILDFRIQIVDCVVTQFKAVTLHSAP